MSPNLHCFVSFSSNNPRESKTQHSLTGFWRVWEQFSAGRGDPELGVPEGHRLSHLTLHYTALPRPSGKCVWGQSFKGDVLNSWEHHHQRGAYSIFYPSNASGLFVGIYDFGDWSRNLYFTLNCIQLHLKQRALPAQEIQSYPKALRNVVAVFKGLPPSQAVSTQG